MGFLVEKDTPGFTSSLQKGKWSLNASVTSELHFEDCHIPADNLLPATTGIKAPLMCLNQARYGIAWGALGAAMACYSEALEYSRSRIQFGAPIASYQLVQEKKDKRLYVETLHVNICLLYTSPIPLEVEEDRIPS